MNLNEAETREFIQMVAKMRPTGDFFKRFNMSSRDVENTKSKLGIVNDVDARKLLSVLRDEDDHERKDLERKIKEEDKKRQERMRDHVKSSVAERKTPKSVVRQSSRKNQIERIQALENLNKHDYSNVDLPNIDENDFKHSARLGRSFLRTKFGLSNMEVSAFLDKLGLPQDV